MLLYSVYSLPNGILPLFGGLIIDKIGIRIGMITFSFVIVFGQAIMWFGAYDNSFAWLLVGRVIIGLGGDSLCVAQSAITTYWFKDNMIAGALAINMSVTRLGSVA